MPAAGKEESILNRLTDKALLLLYSLGSCLLIQPDPVYVGFFFLAVTFSAFSEIWRKDIFLLPGLAVYGLITLAFPQGVFSIPCWSMITFLRNCFLPGSSGPWFLWGSCFIFRPPDILLL